MIGDLALSLELFFVVDENGNSLFIWIMSLLLSECNLEIFASVKDHLLFEKT